MREQSQRLCPVILSTSMSSAHTSLERLGSLWVWGYKDRKDSLSPIEKFRDH